jgi:DNA-binding NarL/FixJ family response regulator
MKKTERLKIYIELSIHPRFEKLPDRLQEALTYMAAGYTDRELSKLYSISHGTPWSYREAIFKRLGFKIYEEGRYNRHTQGPTRAMTLEEIKIKMKI